MAKWRLSDGASNNILSVISSYDDKLITNLILYINYVNNWSIFCYSVNLES